MRWKSFKMNGKYCSAALIARCAAYLAFRMIQPLTLGPKNTDLSILIKACPIPWRDDPT